MTIVRLHRIELGAERNTYSFVILDPGGVPTFTIPVEIPVGEERDQNALCAAAALKLALFFRNVSSAADDLSHSLRAR